MSKSKKRKKKKRKYYTIDDWLVDKMKEDDDEDNEEDNALHNITAGLIFIIMSILFIFYKRNEIVISYLLYFILFAGPGLYLIWSGRNHLNIKNIFLALLFCIFLLGTIPFIFGIEGLIFGESLKWGYKRNLDESIKLLVYGFIILASVIVLYFLYKYGFMKKLLIKIKSLFKLKT